MPELMKSNTASRLKYKFTEPMSLMRFRTSQIQVSMRIIANIRVTRFALAGPSGNVLDIQTAISPKRKKRKRNKEVTTLAFRQSRNKKYAMLRMRRPNKKETRR